MEEILGNSNNSIIGDMSQGAHFCLFYNIKDNLYDIITPYLKDGLENNEICIWILPEHIDIEEAKRALRKVIPDFNAYIGKNQIEIFPCATWHSKNRDFNSHGSLDFWVEKLNNAFNNGYSGLRLAQEIIRPEEKESKKLFIDCEKELNRLILSGQITSLCTYSLEKYSSTEIFDAIDTHEFSLIKREESWERIESSRGQKTEKKKTKEFDFLYSNFTKKIPELGIIVLDSNLLCLVAEGSLLARLGVNREMLKGNTPLKIFGKVSGQRHEECLRRTLNGETLNHEYEWQGKVYSSHYTPLRDEAGKIQAVLIVLQDITGYKQVEEEKNELLRDKNEQHVWLQAIIDSLPVGVWIADSTGKMVFINDIARKIWGGTTPFAENIKGYNRYKAWWSETGELVAAEYMPLARAIRGETCIDKVIDFEQFDGTHGIQLVSSAPIKMSGGTIIGGVAIVQDIIGQKRAEEALRESEFRYRTLFNSIDEGFCIIEVIFDENEKPIDYCFLETNPSFEKQTGLINVAGKRMRELAPKHEKHWFEIYGQIALTGQPARFQNRAEQLHRWYDVYAFRYGEPEKRQVAILFNDITKSKQTEEALRERENQLAAFLEQLPVGLGLFDTQGHWILKNKIFQRFIGNVIPSKDPENSWRWKAWGPDGRLLTKSEWPGARALRGENVPGLDMLYMSDEGLDVWTRVSAVPFRNQAGEIKGAISVIQDIDKQKRVEQALQKSETRLRRFYESGLIGVIYFTLEGKITDANDRFLEMVGYTREDLKAGRVNWEQMTPPEYRSLDDYTIRELKTTGVDTPYEKEYIRKDGSRVPIIIGAAMIDEERHEGIAFVLDITERKQEEHTIRRYTNVLEGINKIFASVVQAGTEEELGTSCLSIALQITDSQVGFIAEVGADGLLYDIAISNMGWDQCLMYDQTGHRRPPANFSLYGLYGSVINSGESFFTNDPPSHPDSIGLPEGHPPLSSFLGVPFILNGKTKGILAVANREEGYTHEQQENLEAIAPAIVQTLEKRKLEEESEQAQQDLTEAYQNAEEKVKARTYELEKAYNSLKENERRLSEAQKIAHIGYWDWDILNDKLYWSEEMYRIFGLAPQGFGATYNTFLNYVHPDDRDFVDNAVKKALTGAHYAVDFRVLTPAEGEERIVFGQGKVLFNNKNDPVLMRGTMQDITEKRQAEKAFLNSVAARKKEIHHRIKNNLQVISSLLDLQAEKFSNKEYLDNPEVFEAFKESQDRVASIALIHEELHEGEGNDTLNFSLYLQRLIKNLFQTYRFGNSDISLNTDLQEDIFFDMDTAVPLGIIVNELVSNSLKYAFPGKNKGEIQIRLYREETEHAENPEDNKIESINKEFKSTGKSRYTLVVSDNGIGIPESISLENSDTLGIQLVTILVDQLDGKLELVRTSGTEFTIKFTVPEKE